MEQLGTFGCSLPPSVMKPPIVVAFPFVLFSSDMAKLLIEIANGVKSEMMNQRFTSNGVHCRSIDEQQSTSTVAHR